MTLGVAWIRNRSDVEELVVASDSLLSAGPETWSACPKILALPRTDAVLSFAGVTELAYPAMLQVSRAIESHPALIERRYDLSYIASLTEDVICQIDSLARSEVSDSLMASRRSTEFLLAGYSWRFARFRIWRYAWNGPTLRFSKRQCRVESATEGRTYRFIGTEKARVEARRSLGELLAERQNPRGLDMEPFEVLTNIIESGRYRDIGGAPQVVKVYRHLNTQVFGALWPPEGDQTPTFAGRPLLSYEKVALPLIDPAEPTHFGKPANWDVD